jgi:hypothetical protein
MERNLRVDHQSIHAISDTEYYGVDDISGAGKKAWKKVGVRVGAYALAPCKPGDARAIQKQRDERFDGTPYKSAIFWSPTAQEIQRVRRLYDNLPQAVLKFVSANTGRIPIMSTDELGVGFTGRISGDKCGIIIGGLNGKRSSRFRYLDHDTYKELTSDENLMNILQHELIHMAMLRKKCGDRLKDLIVLSHVRIFPHAMDAGYSCKDIGGKFYDGVMDESMAMVGEYYKDGDTVRTLAWKIRGYSVVEKKRILHKRPINYCKGTLTRVEAISYSKLWFTLIDDYIT